MTEEDETENEDQGVVVMIGMLDMQWCTTQGQGANALFINCWWVEN